MKKTLTLIICSFAANLIYGQFNSQEIPWFSGTTDQAFTSTNLQWNTTDNKYEFTGNQSWKDFSTIIHGSHGDLFFATANTWANPLPGFTNNKIAQTDFKTNFARMVINYQGNVGIGNLSPQHKLQVAGNVLFENDQADYRPSLMFDLNTNSETAIVQSHEKSSSTNPRHLAINPIGGRVGIGTTSISNTAILHVKGSTYVENGTLTVRGTNGNHGHITMESYDNRNDIDSKDANGNLNSSLIFDKDADGATMMFVDRTKTSSSNSFGTIPFFVSGKGNVSIGSTYASSQYKLTVAGNILCESVKCQMNNDWPDYVFKSGYELKSLNALEKEIQVLGHLPNVPSAQEVEKNGVEVNEMLRLQMEKIEELTLYMIKLQKQNDALQQQITQLKSSVKQ